MLWHFDSFDIPRLFKRDLVLVLSESRSCHQCMLCRCESNSSKTCCLIDDCMSILSFYRDLRLFLNQLQHFTCKWQVWAGEAAFYHSHAIMHSATQCTFSESRKSLQEPAAVLHDTSAQLVFQESNSNLSIWLRNPPGLLKPYLKAARHLKRCVPNHTQCRPIQITKFISVSLNWKGHALCTDRNTLLYDASHKAM